MNKTITIIVLVVIALSYLSGCDSGPSTIKPANFLTDYSKLTYNGHNSYTYVNDKGLRHYHSFIVDPVNINLLKATQSEHNLSAQQIQDLGNYLHSKLIEAVRESGKRITFVPNGGVARIRTALTDIIETEWAGTLPSGSGSGVGGASIELEILDSMFGVQLAAAIESREGSKILFTNFGDMNTAKSVVDNWTSRLKKRLKSFH